MQLYSMNIPSSCSVIIDCVGFNSCFNSVVDKYEGKKVQMKVLGSCI